MVAAPVLQSEMASSFPKNKKRAVHIDALKLFKGVDIILPGRIHGDAALAITQSIAPRPTTAPKPARPRIRRLRQFPRRT